MRAPTFVTVMAFLIELQAFAVIWIVLTTLFTSKDAAE
jgi:hypothetical protein